MTTRRFSLMLALAFVLAGFAAASAAAAPNAPDPATGFLLNGRQLTPQGAQVTLGNFPTGGAVTADGRFLWTVSAGMGANDIRIVDTARRRVIQIIPVAGASGGIALDSRRRRAYVAGVAVSRWWPTQVTLPGALGNVVLVYSWTAATGQARLLRTISVAAVPDAQPMQDLPRPRKTNAWPQKLAVSPDGSRLLVPLNLADSAAVVDIKQADRVRYVQVPSGAYPFGAAILSGGRNGLVSNEATGTVSVIDLQTGREGARDHRRPTALAPRGHRHRRAGRRAYVAVSALDEVVVVDLRRVARDARLARWGGPPGLGTMPVALAISPRGRGCSWPSRAPTRSRSSACRARRPGRPRLDAGRPHPHSRRSAGRGHRRAQGGRAAQLLYVAARGVGVGPNPTGPVTTNPFDPIFWAFNPLAADHRRLRPGRRHHLPGCYGLRPGGPHASALGCEGEAALVRGHAPDPSRGRPEGPGRDAAARWRPHQARLLHRSREPRLRSGAGRHRPRQWRPAPDDLRCERDPQPARPGHALPAPRPRLRQLGGLDPGALLDLRGERARLRRPQLGAGVRGARPAQTTSASTP